MGGGSKERVKERQIQEEIARNRRKRGRERG